MEQRISLVTLGVRDLQRARKFYEALGWSAPSSPTTRSPSTRRVESSSASGPRSAVMARPEWSWRITSGRPRRSTSYSLTPSAPAGPLSDRRNGPNGAATPVPSPIPKGMCGRSPTIQVGRWQTMAQSGSRSRLPIRLPVAPGTRWRRAEHLVPEHVGTGERRAVECVEKGRHADPFDPARAYQSDRIEAIRRVAVV